VFESDGLGKASVSAEIVAHERGPKLRVFKFKPKRGYKRRTGHRQDLTQIEVTEISSGGGKPAAKAARAKRADTEGEPAKAGGATPAKSSARATKAQKQEADDGS
jgi:hypothetical protein